MKRVNLLEYYELAEALNTAKRNLSGESMKGSTVWVNLYSLPPKLRHFVADDNGFSACKRVATDLADAIRHWVDSNLMDGNSPGTFSSDKFDQDFPSWELGNITAKFEQFKSVFAAECADIDVYSVGQISIYKTSALVSKGEEIIPEDIQPDIPVETLIEFNSAGKCLAFDLPTACGFHALRGVELVMEEYLRFFGQNTAKMKTWSDYIRSAIALINDPKADEKPSEKVAAMLDRMRALDRNPLMHPRDTLDPMQADMLFKLCAITVTEIARDLKAKKVIRLTPPDPDAANDERVPALPQPKRKVAA